MKIATAAEMRQIDDSAINAFGIPGVVLMENAGVEVVRRLEQVLGDVAGKKVCLFAGKGNNGGDGFVVARHLHNQGCKVKVFLLGEKAAIKGDAQINAAILTKMGLDVMEVIGERDWDKVRIAVTFADCIIDALLGTGFHGEVSGPMAEAINIINSAGKMVVAIDVPSGVDADNGQIRGTAVRASYTITFGLPKPGMFLYPGALCVGELSVADIGIPASLLNASYLLHNAITTDLVRQLLPHRHPAAHKGSNGHVGVVAGSVGFTGAAALTASGALRTGAGLVTVGVGASLNGILEVKLTEAMTRPLPDIAGGALGLKAVPYIAEMAEKCSVLAVGPGMGRAEETMAAVREIVKQVEKPLVLDADALTALVGHTSLLTQCESLAVVTPHPGEMARLTGLSPLEINQNRIGVAKQAACKWGSIVVLKGAGTIVAFPDGEVFINTTGNAGMASGGSGDVLTGVIAALIAQGLSSHDAAIAGVFIHGLAGDIAARAGMHGLIASDLLQALPAAIFAIQNNTK